MTLSVWSESTQGADVECGYPSSGIHNPKGAHLWQRCYGGTWRFRVTGDGSGQSYVGDVVSTKPFASATPVKTEKEDSVETSTDSKTIAYSLNPGTGADGFDFDVDEQADTCVSLNTPTDEPILVGATSVYVYGPFDLETLQPCGSVVDISPESIALDENAGIAKFTISLSASQDQDVTISYETRTGSAKEGDDFLDATESVTIAAGETTYSGQVTIIDDSELESTETFDIVLTQVDGAETGVTVAAVSILDNDSALPQLSINDVAIDEAAGTASFTVSLSAASTVEVDVDYATLDGTAVDPDDYTAGAATLVFASGVTSLQVAVPIVDDALVEGDETFTVELSNPVNADIADGSGAATIQDNDAASGSGDVVLADPGPYAYLDDVDEPISPSLYTGNDIVEGLGWPLIGLADSEVGKMDAEVMSKWHMIATQNPASVAEAQAINPDLIYLRHVNPVGANSLALPFDDSGPTTGGGDVYAGHWVYQAGTSLTSGIGSGDSVLDVEDASLFESGDYVVVYDAPAGSFDNAEHMKVTSVKKSDNSLNVAERGFKSDARSHRKGSIVAAHVPADAAASDKEYWLYNYSTECPRDANGNQLSEVMVAWIRDNYDRSTNDGTRVNIRVDGIQFDVDQYFLLDNEADVDNDLSQDNGITADGFLMWHEGLEDFYTQLRDTLPEMIIVGGTKNARGMDSLNGVQMEGFPGVYGGAYDVEPNYGEVDTQLSNYGLRVRNHTVEPAFTMVLTKTPTLQYPDLGPNRGSQEPKPTSNAPFRFSFGLSLLDDGFYGQPCGNYGKYKEECVWWDEYSVDLSPNSPTYGQAIPTNAQDESEVRKHMGWMGVPLGERVRYYDSADYDAANSLLGNGGFESGIQGWSGKNVELSRVTGTEYTVSGSSALHASQQLSYSAKLGGAQIKGPKVYLEKDKEYTLAFAAKASSFRRIKVTVGSSTRNFVEIPDRWVRRVLGFTAESTDFHQIQFKVGYEDTEVWLDEIYLFEGNTSVFQRDFENARIVVNATSRPRAVDLGGTFRRIKGTQDPINDGSTLTEVTLDAYDAAILIRP